MKALLFLAAAAVLAGCTAPESHEFVIKADSVRTPGAWPGGAPMTAKVYAYIGPNLCWRFKEFRIEGDSHGARVTIIGTHSEPPGTMCAQALAFMTGTDLVIQPPLNDPFELRIMQPDGTTLSRTIRME